GSKRQCVRLLGNDVPSTRRNGIAPAVWRSVMADNRIKDRVTVMFNGTPSDTAERPAAGNNPAMPAQALQVLTLAQRTAEEHISSAHRQADKIRQEAMAAAEQIARDAEAHAQNVRREAEKVLAEARATAERVVMEAQTRLKEAQREAEKVLSDAQAQAKAIVARAEQDAEELQLQAQRRYDDVVGSLAAKREALQQQIEALERFDREYRARLMAFMQAQLRALWADQPQVTDDLGQPSAEPEEAPQDEEAPAEQRSEERRVGKECRAGGSAESSG